MLRDDRQPSLIERAHELTPARAQEPELHDAWQLVFRVIEHLPLGADDLRELLDDLRQGRDHVLEELGFDFLDGRMRVSFLGDRVYCEPAALIRLLARLADAARA